MMASKKTSLEGCIAHVYDTQDNLLATSKITNYDPEWTEIEIEECPDVRKGDTCRILILSFPSPCEYMGTVRRQMKLSAVIALYRRQEKENRKNARYKVNVPAAIEKILCAGLPCEIPLPLAVKLLDLSRGGIRINTEMDMLAVGDRFALCLKAGDKEEHLFAEVINATWIDPDRSEYGCRFIKKEQVMGE